MSRPVRGGGWFSRTLFKMIRLSPPAKGGVIGIILFFLSGPASHGQTDTSEALYRLEKLGVLYCDFGQDHPAEETRTGDRLDFRVGPNGHFYFINYDAGRLYRFGPGGKFLRSVPVGSSLSHFRTGFGIGPEGDILILDGGQGFLHRFDAALDLLGKSPLQNGGELERVYDFAAVSWGKFLIIGESRPNFWKLEPAGKYFSLKPAGEGSAARYLSLSEMSGSRLLATDGLGRLKILDRYGNLLKAWPAEKGAEVAVIGEKVFVFYRTRKEMALLDSTGVFLLNWKMTELDPELEKNVQFQVAQDKIYFLLAAPWRIAVFRLVSSESDTVTAGGGMRE
ncbi:MAG: hypothetical protein L0196_00325 [candidate division Zixibacteria bacterium]|nr:hypothetical protein [candidate division Zixibacteria bacterium]